MIRRREIIKGLACAGVGAVTGFPAAQAAATDALAIGFGLDTDRPFSQGAQARLITLAPRSSDTFEALVGTLRDARGSRIYTLVEPGMGALVEEAAKDCRMALLGRFGLPPTTPALRKEQSRLVGRLVASGQLTPTVARPVLVVLALRSPWS